MSFWFFAKQKKLREAASFSVFGYLVVFLSMFSSAFRDFTERQSWMLPDLSVQMKTTNAPQLKIN